MPFDPSAEPWLNARVLLAEYGDDAVGEIWWRAQNLPADQLTVELPALVATMQAIRVLREAREPRATVH